MAQHFHFTTWFWTQTFQHIPNPSDKESIEFSNHLSELKKVVDSAGGVFILGTYPSTLGQEKSSLSNTVRRFAKSQNVTMLDFESRFIHQGRKLSVDGVHPNRKGNELIADMLLDRIIQGRIAGLAPF
jgi:lysophospholipase L1-like esterase